MYLQFVKDPGYLIFPVARSVTGMLLEVRSYECRKVRNDEAGNQRITATINALRDLVCHTMVSLD